MSDETRPAEEAAEFVAEAREGAPVEPRHLRIAEALVVVERECAELREERDALASRLHIAGGEKGALTRQLADAQAQLVRWKSEALRHCANYESQFYARRDAEARAEQAEATIAAVRTLVEAWPDGDERRSEYAAARGQCKREVIVALAAAGPSAPETPSDLTERYFETLLATTDDPTEKAHIEDQRAKSAACPYSAFGGALYLDNLRRVNPSERTIAAAEAACTCGKHRIVPAGSDEPARCEHGKTEAHVMVSTQERLMPGSTLPAAHRCPGPAASGTPE